MRSLSKPDRPPLALECCQQDSDLCAHIVPIGSAGLCRNTRFYAGWRMRKKRGQRAYYSLRISRLLPFFAGVRNAEVVGSSPMRSTTPNSFPSHTYRRFAVTMRPWRDLPP